MKKKPNSKNALKLVAATSMTIFSLLSVFSATAAWFDSQRNLNNGANEMGVSQVQSAVTSVTLHEYYGYGVDSDENDVFGFNPAADSAHTLLLDDDEVHFLFTNNQSWSNVYIYAWKDGGTEKNAEWPGVQMSYFGQNDYDQGQYLTALNTEKYDQMIFNNGSDQQTVDITITNEIISARGIYPNTYSDSKWTIGTWTVQKSHLAFQMGTYSPEEPNHPVLLLFQVQGGAETISATSLSDYFLAPPAYSVTVETKAAFNAALSGYADGTMVFVRADESQDNKGTVYKCLNTGVGSASAQLKWVDPVLQQNGNPLSSAIQTHSFVFNYDPKTTNLESGTLTHNGVSTSRSSYIPFAKSGFTDTNKASFVTVNGNDASFTKKIDFYDGDTTGYQYIGIVVDYNDLALGYMYSYYLGSNYLNEGLGFLCDWSLTL